ncbi:MAG: hypothetical protein R3272_04740 [Candidatus Promineifilaceae bacterium]|nr:hypothetical protein [Candidatus Promineifilaceae bacterium]
MDTNEVIVLSDDPQAAAAVADLVYVDCEGPGFVRKRWGRGFTYLDEAGDHIQDEALRERFEELTIPPAWSDVWICPDERGHVQVTGRDAKGRKQYIYHPRWEEVRSQTKFNRMILFAQALPALREQIDSHLRKHGTPRERVLAAVIRLLQESLIRIGNPEYAQANESYGLTTLKDEHLELAGSRLHFEFTGKSGKEQKVDVRDPRVARVVRQLQELPGQELFQYVDETGERRRVGSGDVNVYIREATGRNFTAKDFRTWGGTVHAVNTLREFGPPADEKDVGEKRTALFKEVAEKLGNTPAICRDYYVHPAVVAAYEEGSFFDLLQDAEEMAGSEWLEKDEQATLLILQHSLAGSG